jgi:hypothetical protein
MSATGQLHHEARMRPRYAVTAGVAAVLLIAGAVVQQLGPRTSVTELTVELLTAHKAFASDLVGAILNALGSVALAATLVFIFDVARARNPRAQSFIRVIAWLGPILVAITGVAYAIVIGIKANQFATSGAQTYVEANRLTSSGILVVLQLLGQLAALLLTAGYVFVALNAMRVGLLTRFMGYLGIFAGVLVLVQITQVPVVQAYWLAALAVLLSGRWPSGMPRSWESGRPEPWPSSRELREQRMKAAGAAPRGRPKPAREPVAAAAPAGGARTSAKRKRKRRK